MHTTTLVSKLKRDLERGRVVTIAGTGISVATCGNACVDGYPVATWSGLLRHGVAYCDRIGVVETGVVKILTMQIESGETDMLIGAAETISQRLLSKSPGTFHGWLKDALAGLPVRDPSLIEVLQAMPGILATLNYDDLVERVTKRRSVTWQETERVQEILHGECSDAVLHLHGAFTAPDSVVLGLRSYLAVRDHPHTKAVLELATMGHTLVFIGCGDTLFDPNFARLIEWSAAVLKDVTPRHYYLCREQEVSALQRRLHHAPWLQMLPYGQQHADLGPFLRGLLPLQPVPTPVASSTSPPLDLKAYRQAMRKRYGRLKLEDLDPTTHDLQALSLMNQYVPQDALEWRFKIKRSAHSPRENTEPETVDLAPASVDFRRLRMEEHPSFARAEGGGIVEGEVRAATAIAADPQFDRLVILGDPGSGKSTLLQYLLLEWAETPGPDEQLIVLIELREYARLRQNGEVTSFISYLQTGAAVRWQFEGANLNAWLRAHPSLVLFDGLDEVFDPNLRNEVSVAIHRFADDYPRTRVLISSRRVDFRYQAWSHEGFRIFVLRPLNDLQVTDFLTRWHRAVYEDASLADSRLHLLTAAMRETAAIRSLAANPLLLTMMAILSRTQELPRDRAELYEQCVRLLLHQWKADLAFAQDPELARGSLDYQDKRGLMLRVAYVMQTRERGLTGNLIDEASLEKVLAEGLQGFPNLRPRRAARALIEQLRGRNFMLSSVGPRFYAFVHRTFLEYFCALEIRDRFQNEQVLTLDELKQAVFGRWKDSSWHEVLCLLCGMLAPRFVAEILTWLVDQPADSRDKFPLNPRFMPQVTLAALCLNEVRKRNEIPEADALVRSRLEAAMRDDQQPRFGNSMLALIVRVWRNSPDTPAWLKARAQPPEDPDLRAAALQELAAGWSGAPGTLELVQSAAQSADFSNVRAAAITQLAQHWRNHADTLPIIRVGAESDSEFDVRVAAIKALSTGWKDDPETLPWLKSRIVLDPSSSVRQAILRKMANEWSMDPDVARLIKERARSDPSGDMRRVAIVELARRLGGDDEALKILKERATSDEASFVRWTAFEEVARGWRDDPETLGWLKSLGVTDTSTLARGAALRAIARGWPDDPGALQWLDSRAQSDPDGAVRKVAQDALPLRTRSEVEPS